MEKLSFVIPCYGSEFTIENVIHEIHKTMSQRPEFDYEIICVNDCSPDGVLGVLIRLAENDSRVTVADLTKNMGKISAVLAGYSLVSGDYVVDMDDDGQCPMDKLWDLFDELNKGYDIVYAAYTKRSQSAFKNFGSAVNAFMARHLIGKPKSLMVSNFSIIRRLLIDEIKKYKSPHPYTLGYFLKTTCKIANVKMEERDRFAGEGNFNFRKSFALWLNGFTAFSVIPLRISSLIGFLTALAGFVYGITIIIRRLFIAPYMTMGYPSTMAALLFIGGMIMLMLGMLGEYVGRIYLSQNNLPQYVIREVYKSDKTYIKR